jgi:hypothetical protein
LPSQGATGKPETVSQPPAAQRFLGRNRLSGNEAAATAASRHLKQSGHFHKPFFTLRRLYQTSRGLRRFQMRFQSPKHVADLIFEQQSWALTLPVLFRFWGSACAAAAT